MLWQYLKVLMVSTKEDKERWLNQRSTDFCIVLNDNELKLFKNSRNIFNKFMCSESLSPVFIAVNYHDKDYDEEEHRLKTEHYHIALQLGKMCRIGTILKTICDLFHCNENQVSIEKCSSICMYSRYLCHLDDYDKFQYFESDVITNDKDVLSRYYSLVIVRDLHDLITVVKHYRYNLEEIMQNVAHYDKWRKYINDLIINYHRSVKY